MSALFRINSSLALLLAFVLSLVSLFGFAYLQVVNEVEGDAKVALQYLEHRLDEAVASVKELDALPYESCDSEGQAELRDFFYNHLNGGLFLIRRLDAKPWHYCTMFGSVSFNVQAGMKLRPLLAHNEDRVLLAMARYQRKGEEKCHLFVGYLGDDKISSVRMNRPDSFAFFEDDKMDDRRVEVRLDNGDKVFVIGNFTGRAAETIRTDSERYPIYLSSAVTSARIYHKVVELALLFLPVYLLLLWLCGYLLRLVYKARLSMGYRLYQAVHNRELQPYYQPIVDVTTGEIVGAEALIRWVRGDGSVEQPVRFINELEQSELITRVTLDVLKQIPTDLKPVLSQAANFRCSVNLVPCHLENTELVTALEHWSGQGYPCHQLALEITERLPITQLAMARASIIRLRELGICIELDDAGTGYGGASYLQELHIDVMKIDKLFVEPLLISDDRSQVLDAYVQLARTLNLELIAEGVETQAQSDTLLAKGVKFQQGYLFSRPLSAAEFVSFWQQQCVDGRCRIFDGIHGRETNEQRTDGRVLDLDRFAGAGS
ncbi:EAL domain-containing protein [Shewanella sp. GXUN23E]|uniref:EAL domain-containing protein n=1 Tax=Shewanella sp. GXUN23E TaxID=3422498 RepID=UPI003D7D54E1